MTAQTSAEAHAKADAWLEEQRGVKNVTKHAYVFRAAFSKDGPKDEGVWTVAVRTNKNLNPKLGH